MNTPKNFPFFPPTRTISLYNYRCSEVTPAKESPSPSPPLKNPSVIEQPKMAPTKLDRIFLTWSGQFKTKADIPSILPGDVVHRARSFARIRINIGFLCLGAIGAGISIYLGKRDVRRGESIEKQNLEWHRQINEEHKRSGSK